MAYMSQEKKAKLAVGVKKALAKHGLKGTLSVRHHMSLVLTIKSGAIDFIRNFNDTVDPRGQPFQPAQNSIDVNPYWYRDHFSGAARDALRDIFTAMNDGNHDRSEPQVDHFDVGWYVTVHVGRWDKPYVCHA